MATDSEPKARFPRQEVREGQKHGYIGDVEIYDDPAKEPGATNVKSVSAPSGDKSKKGPDGDKADGEKPVVGDVGAVVSDEGKVSSD